MIERNFCAEGRLIHAAKHMRDLDQSTRDAAIAAAPNVFDIRQTAGKPR